MKKATQFHKAPGSNCQSTGQSLQAKTHLTGTMAALPRQVLPMNQRACGSTALKWEPRINESGGSGVVVHKKCLGYN